tara:strand:+ start:314 stop:1237 length:924 start_codon:yes stop_codon:yes gene_type:complete
MAKVLILGGSGFVGKSIARHLEHNKINYSSPKSKILNLKKFSKISEYLKKNKFSHIINCAGLVGGISKNIKYNINFFEENLEINYNLIKAVKDSGVKNFINLGTSCMYPIGYNTRMSENKLMTNYLEKTNFGYALAKLSTSFYLKMLKNNSDINCVTVIPCNLYGPNDNFDQKSSHLVAAIIKKVVDAKIKNQKYIIGWGSGNVKREFMYVDDLSKLIIKLVESNKKYPEFLNVGYGKDFKVSEFYYRIINLIDKKIKIKWNKTKPEGIKRKIINSNLAKKLYNWKASTKLNIGLKETINYYNTFEL